MSQLFNSLFFKNKTTRAAQNIGIILRMANLSVVPILFGLTSSPSILIVGLAFLLLFSCLGFFNQLTTDYTALLFKSPTFSFFLRKRYGKKIEKLAALSTIAVALLQLSLAMKLVILFFQFLGYTTYQPYGLVFVACSLAFFLLTRPGEGKLLLPAILLFLGVLGTLLLLIDGSSTELGSFLKKDYSLFKFFFLGSGQKAYAAIYSFFSSALVISLGAVHPLFHLLFLQAKHPQRAKQLTNKALFLSFIYFLLLYLTVRSTAFFSIGLTPIIKDNPYNLSAISLLLLLFFIFYTKILGSLLHRTVQYDLSSSLSFFAAHKILFLSLASGLSLLATLLLTWSNLLWLLQAASYNYAVAVYFPFLLNLIGLRPKQSQLLCTIGVTQASMLSFLLFSARPAAFVLASFAIPSLVLEIAVLLTVLLLEQLYRKKKGKEGLQPISSLDSLVFLIKKQQLKKSIRSKLIYFKKSASPAALLAYRMPLPKKRPYYWLLGSYLIGINYALHLLQKTATSSSVAWSDFQLSCMVVGLVFLFYGFYLNPRYSVTIWHLALIYGLLTYSLVGLSVNVTKMVGPSALLAQVVLSMNLFILSLFIGWSKFRLAMMAWVGYQLISSPPFFKSFEAAQLFFLLQVLLLTYWSYARNSLAKIEKRMHYNELQYLERTSQLRLQNLEHYDDSFLQRMEGVTSNSVAKLPSELDACIQSCRSAMSDQELAKRTAHLQEKLKAFSFYWQGAVDRVRDVRDLVLSPYSLDELLKKWMKKMKKSNPYFEAFVDKQIVSGKIVHWDEEQLFAVLNNAIRILQHRNKQGSFFFIQLVPASILYKRTEKEEEGLSIRVSQQILPPQVGSHKVVIQELLDKKQSISGLSPYNMHSIHNHYGRIKFLAEKKAYEITLPINLNKLTPFFRKDKKTDFLFEKFSEEQVLDLVNGETAFWQEALRQRYAFKKLKKAIIFMMKQHQGQLRKSGIYFYSHPLWVATQIMKVKAEEATVIASLLHDVVEESYATLAEVELAFGQAVAQLVKEVSLLKGNLKERYGTTEYKELHDKVKNISEQAFLVKTFDRLHNVATLQFLSEKSQLYLQREVQNFYIPLLHELKHHALAKQLEALLAEKLGTKEEKG